jgi:hypothetical protein
MQVMVDEDDPLAIKTRCQDEANLMVVPLQRDGLSLSIDQGWTSCSYGTKVEAPVVRYSKWGLVPAQFVTVLFPCKAHRTAAEVSQIAEAVLAQSPLKTNLAPERGEQP